MKEPAQDKILLVQSGTTASLQMLSQCLLEQIMEEAAEKWLMRTY